MTFKPKKRADLAAIAKPLGKVKECAAYCEKRGIRLDYAQRGGVSAIPESAAKEHIPNHVAGAVLHIAYPDLDGAPLMDNGKPYARTRPLRAIGGNKFNQPSHSKNHLFFAPLTKKRSWVDVAKDPRVHIYDVEGEFKALALGQRGLAAIAIGGIGNYMTRLHPDDQSTSFLPDFQKITWAGRNVVLVMDHDAIVKPELRRHIWKHGSKLKAAGANVFVIELPNLGDGVSGADDFIKAKGFAAFQELPRYSLDDRRYSDIAGGAVPLSFAFKPLPKKWFSDELPPQEFLIEDLYPEGAVALGIGQGAVGKTYFFMRMAVAIASGGKFLGKNTSQGRVLYIGLEETARVFRRRLFRITKNFTAGMSAKKASEFRALVRNNLLIKSLVGRQLHLVEMDRGTVVQSAALLRLIGDLQGQEYRLVILDPLSRLHGIDENGNQAGTALINAGERIAQDVPCSVLITHHTGKQNTSRTDAYAARGASALADAARVAMILTALSPEDCANIGMTDPHQIRRGVLQFTLAKISHAAKQDPMFLLRDEGGDLHQFTPDRSANHPDSLASALRAYCDEHKTGVTLRAASEDLRVQIFGDAVSKRTVQQWFKSAVASSTLREAGKNKSGNGQLYRPAQEATDE